MEPNNPQDLGLGLAPGDAHYRAFVGPPEDYDLIAAMTFGLLTTLGLRQHHRVLDIGCGSLRVGRLLIPYLNRAGYVGIEPNRWLVEEGIASEIGESQVQIKQPRFCYDQSGAELLGQPAAFDFAVAQSIFSHTGGDLLENWLATVSRLLKPTGALVATFLPAEMDTREKGWIYPGCVNYTMATMQACAQRHGLAFRTLDWRHPRQTWALFSKPSFDTDWFTGKALTWNTFLDHITPKPIPAVQKS